MFSEKRKDASVGDLNSCHVNKWAMEAAGCTLLLPWELFTLILSLVVWLDKDENPQHQVLKETEEAHKPIYRVSLDQFSSFESY